MNLRSVLKSTLIIMVIIGLFIFISIQHHQLHVTLKRYVINSTPAEPKKIVFGTAVFGETFNWITNEDLQNCSTSNCVLVTDDRSQVDDADAVIFHAADISNEIIPNVRHSFQRYVFLNLESEAWPHVFVPDWPGFFNLTMTYRLDSDVVSKYGHYRKRKVSEQRNEKINYAKGKTKMAVWFVSHCDTSSRREDLVKVLQKFIDVDVYGECGNLSCPRTVDNNQNHECMEMAEKTYKFYLSFENSLCPDYVTEKLFKALEYDIVPITYGAATYSKFAPPNSYINVFDFKDPKELADYLILLDGNDEMYNRYFKWKKKFVSVTHFREGWCNLCEKLNKIDEPPKSYKNMYEWWNSGRCITNKNWLV